MVMELLEGESLASLLERRGTLTLGEAAMILTPVGRALEAAHDKGIVHRDLKPDNIFLDRGSDGLFVPKVLDFGIAKLLDPEAVVSGTQGGQTKTESILGTPHYMSFEQAMSDKTIDHRTDVWSFGVILYELLVGERPLKFENLGQMYTLLLQGEVPSVRVALPDLPQAIADLIDQCLKKNREERLAGLGPLLDALESVDVGETTLEIASRTSVRSISSLRERGTQDPVAATQGDTSVTRSRGAWLIGLAVAAVAAAIAIVGSLGDGESPAAASLDSETEASTSAATTAAPATTTNQTTTSSVDSSAETTTTASPTVSSTVAPPRIVQRPATAAPKPTNQPPPPPPPPPPPAKGISTASPY
jgi:serine/threonine-protein kinase